MNPSIKDAPNSNPRIGELGEHGEKTRGSGFFRNPLNVSTCLSPTGETFPGVPLRLLYGSLLFLLDRTTSGGCFEFEIGCALP